MSEARTTVSGLKISTVFYDFIVNEALPGTGLDAPSFWEGLAGLVKEFSGHERRVDG